MTSARSSVRVETMSQADGAIENKRRIASVAAGITGSFGVGMAFGVGFNNALNVFTRFVSRLVAVCAHMLF